MKAEHSVRSLCATFEVKRSGYHTWLKAPESQRETTDAVLRVKIQATFARHKSRYGAPRIQEELAGQGDKHGVKRIARLMKADGLQGLCSRRFVPQTTDSNHDEPIAANLLGITPAPTRPDQTWVTDLTYVWTQEGWLYVAVMLDLWSRRVVGWATGETLHASLAQRALAMAVQHRQPERGLLHHSDRGVQYASRDYREQLKQAGCVASMSRKGNPYDNAAMESFNATYKRECVGLAEAQGGYTTRAQAANDFFDYVEKYYNRVRRHSRIDCGACSRCSRLLHCACEVALQNRHADLLLQRARRNPPARTRARAESRLVESVRRQTAHRRRRITLRLRGARGA